MRDPAVPYTLSAAVLGGRPVSQWLQRPFETDDPGSWTRRSDIPSTFQQPNVRIWSGAEVHYERPNDACGSWNARLRDPHTVGMPDVCNAER